MPLSRRDFLAGAAAGFASLAVARDDDPATPPPSDRLGVGVIGCGGQGSHHLGKLVRNPKVAVVGVSDVYQPRLERARATAGQAPGFRDYRELLALPSLDAVWIATPDHWHGRMAIDAMEAGKDVYLEKPMALHWQEAREIHRAAKRLRRVVQVGSQDCSRPIYWKARELVREGRLGKLVWSQTSICRNLKEGDWNWAVDLDASPKNLDWEAFLGPAPRRPFDPERFFRWRKYWDYSGGIATDLYVHVLHALCIPIGPEFPSRVMAGGGVYIHKDRDTPDSFFTLIDYPSEHSVVVVGTQCNEQGLPIVVRGHRATMYLGGTGGELIVRPERIFGGEELKLDVGDVPDPIQSHHDNFLDCVRRRDPRTNCDVDLAYRVDVAVDLAVESWRKHKVCRFDPAREEELA
jgi:predicted dehydrogenase